MRNSLVGKDLLIPIMLALLIHIGIFLFNPSLPDSPPILIGERKLIEVRLVKSLNSDPLVPKTEKKPKKAIKKIKNNPQKVPLPQPIQKKAPEKPAEKVEIKKIKSIILLFYKFPEKDMNKIKDAKIL